MAEQKTLAQPTPLNQKWVLLIALLFGLTAAVLNWIYMGQASKASISVLKVKGPKSILAGTPVTREMFQNVTVTGDVAEMKDMVVDADSFSAFNQQPVAETLRPGYILMTRSFQVTGEGGLRDSIAPNQVALSLNIDREAQAVGYNVKPGDMVIIRGDIGGEPVPIARNVCVRAVGDAYSIPGESARDGRYRSVTVFIPDGEEPISNFLANVNASGNKITLGLKGACSVDTQAEISPKYKIRPELKALPKQSEAAPEQETAPE